jgi:hypothetical protein
MFKNEADFEKLVGRLNIDNEPNPAHRENLRRQMLSAFNETSEQSESRTTVFQTLGRTITKSPITKLAAAAAVIIIAVLIGIHQFGGSIESVALADVIEAMHNAEWAHYHFVIDVTGVDEKIAKNTPSKGWEGWQSVNPLRSIEKHNNGKIYFTEENKGKTSYYDLGTNTITYKNLSTSQQDYAGIGDVYIKQISAVEKQGGKVNYEEGIYEGYPVIIISVDFTSGGGKRTKMSIIVDPETHLPKKLTAQQWLKGQYEGLISGTFDYPDDGPGDIYALGVPRTAKIIDKTRLPVVNPTLGHQPVPTPGDTSPR